MIKVRANTFETNSSSTHAIVMCNSEEFELVQKNKMFIERWGESLISYEDVLKRIAEIREDIVDEEGAEELDRLQDELKAAYTADDTRTIERTLYKLNSEYDLEVCTYDTYGEDYETFCDHFTTKSGDVVYAFGYYGRDC